MNARSNRTWLKRFAAATICLAVALLFAACSPDPPPDVPHRLPPPPPLHGASGG